MRLYSGKVRPLSQEIVNALVTAKAIETEGREEVVRDLESVFNAFLAADKEVNDRAKHLLDVRNLPQTEFSRVRKAAAEQKGIKTGDEMFDYLLDQCNAPRVLKN